ncbi:mannose-1-phosphate guanylyltransferase/mannose-6-phosphate isomerase [Helicobacter sp. 23-1044]
MKIAILCGGSGSRLFPISRELMPKQFVPFFGENSLFKETILRNLPFAEDFVIITNEAHYFLAKNEVEGISQNLHFILECVSKNTASALLFVALQSKSDEVILALPSDHIIKDLPKYKCAIQNAESLAKQGKIALFGITPTNANTGYGYISDKNGKVAFFEKPDFATAQKYLKDGGYFWNSGMFCFKAGVLIDEFKKYHPKLLKLAQTALKNALKASDFTHLKCEDCESLEDISIDYAIMEKSQNLALIKADFSWSDVGSFDALSDEYPKDSAGNASKGEVLALDSANNFILSEKLTALVGANDLIVVDSADCLMIAKRGESQNVKKITQILKQKNSDLVKFHNLVFRPWGSYQVLLESAFYKIKKIVVRPKKRLSLQKHFHRNEHWIVVSGSAVVSVNGEEFVLNRNESTYIPMGSVHRLSNEGKIDLVIIEAQVGEYLGEDDIVRIDDDFNRK